MPGNLADNAQNRISYSLRAQAHTSSPMLTFSREGALIWRVRFKKGVANSERVCYNGKWRKVLVIDDKLAIFFPCCGRA
jgi:hypothetical protein